MLPRAVFSSIEPVGEELNRKRVLKTVGAVSLFSVLMTGQAFADSATDFAWQTSGTGTGFSSRTWTSHGENSISLYTCTANGPQGRVAISIHHEYTLWPDSYVGSNSWSCDNSAFWKAYPNDSAGNFHWTLDQTPSGCSSPNGECPVNMQGHEWFN